MQGKIREDKCTEGKVQMKPGFIFTGASFQVTLPNGFHGISLIPPTMMSNNMFKEVPTRKVHTNQVFQDFIGYLSCGYIIPI